MRRAARRRRTRRCPPTPARGAAARRGARYARLAASGCPKTPTTPHSSWNLSNMAVRRRTADSKVPAASASVLERPLHAVAHPLDRQVDQVADHEASAAHFAEHGERHVLAPREIAERERDAARSAARRACATGSRRRATRRGAWRRSSSTRRAEPGHAARQALGERHGEPALGDVVRRAHEPPRVRIRARTLGAASRPRGRSTAACRAPDRGSSRGTRCRRAPRA